MSTKIKLEKDKKMRYNGGFGFISFISNLQVKRCLYKGDFKKLIMDNVPPEERLESFAL